MWPFSKKTESFTDGGFVPALEPKEPEIRQPVAAILRAMIERPDDFQICYPELYDSTDSENNGYERKITDRKAGVDFSVRNYRHFLGGGYCSSEPWIDNFEAYKLWVGAIIIQKSRTDALEKTERDRICALYNVSAQEKATD